MKQISTASKEEARIEFEHLEDWVRMKVQGFIQDMLEEEVDSLLGRAKHERHKAVDGVKGYRNGHGKRRRVSLKTGTVYVKRPRVSGVLRSVLRAVFYLSSSARQRRLATYYQSYIFMAFRLVTSSSRFEVCLETAPRSLRAPYNV